MNDEDRKALQLLQAQYLELLKRVKALEDMLVRYSA